MSEATTPEQTLHRVFVTNLNFQTNEEALEGFLSEAGKVKEVIIVRRGKRSKGYGFAGYDTQEEADKAVKELTKKELDGREIRVQISNPQAAKKKPKKNKRASKRTGRKNAEASESSEEEEQTAPAKAKEITTVNTSKEQNDKNEKEPYEEESGPNTSVFVANLPFRMGVPQLYALFKEYKVTSAMIARHKATRPGRRGRSKGYGFVELESTEEQERLLKEFGTVELKGRTISVRAATSQKKKPSRRTKTKQEKDDKESGNEKTKKSKKSNKKQKEALDAVKQAEEGVKEVKKEDGVNAASAAADAVKEVKKEDGVQAAHEAAEAVKEVKKEDGKDAAKAATEAVKEVKKEDGKGATKTTDETVKEVKKEDSKDTAKTATETTQDKK
ncbi:hypothetical protein BCV72DRAFT_248894 [Rhizopus microsporus var. microsporus]|uniref:RRM domain-containing protein n=1 Tax=Rhizopus microsporus var. microsporus TaxID=86635 RepID=A0A1X0R8K0_RHIZD|nr:hypothetical protein BCV72DRAFT_248894 [Rhizopus microsporus var. microsporus]